MIKAMLLLFIQYEYKRNRIIKIKKLKDGTF